jgi:hypothetical protein
MLKNSFNKIIENKLSPLTQSIRESILHSRMASQDMQAMQILKQYDIGNSYFPYTSFSLSPSTILHIINDLFINKRKVIVEFGSGRSTLFLLKFIQYHQLDTKLFSVESDLEYSSYLNDIVNSNNLNQDNFYQINAPIVESNFHYQGKNSLWYEEEMVSKSLPDNIDLVIVDGPASSYDAYVRYPAVPAIQQKLNKDFSIFLDDTYREAESSIAIEWEKVLTIKKQEFLKYTLFTTKSDFSTKPYFEGYPYKIDMLNKK